MDSTHAENELKKTPLDLQKRFPTNQMLGGQFLRLGIPIERLCIPPRTGWSGKKWLTGNVMSTAYWSSILKISRIVHTIDFILKFLYLACEFKASGSIFDQVSPRNCVECWALKSLQFFHFSEAFLISFSKIPILLQQLFMNKLMISSKLFVSCQSTINLTSLILDNSIQLLNTSSIIIGLEFVFLNLNSTISDNLLSLSFRRILVCSLSELCLGISRTLEMCKSNGLTTGLSVLSWLTDDDWLDDKPSSWEWQARQRLASSSRMTGPYHRWQVLSARRFGF